MTDLLARTRTRARAVVAVGPLVVRRRARRDAGLLLGTALLLLGALLVALALPRLVARTADEALQGTVDRAGTDAAAVVTQLVGQQPAEAIDFVRGHVEQVWSEHPTLAPPTTVVSTRPFVVGSPSGDVIASLVMLDGVEESRPTVRWVEGREPAAVPADEQWQTDAPDRPRVVEAGLSVPAARALGVDVTDGPVTLRLDTESSGRIARVTGLYEVADPAARHWSLVPDVVAPVPTPPNALGDLRVALYVPFELREDVQVVGANRALTAVGTSFLRTDGLSVAQAHGVSAALVALGVRGQPVATNLPAVLDAFDARLTAVRAQAALVVVGIAATAASCLVLAGGLLATRRRPTLAAERARGASVASVAYRAALESVPVTLVASVLAFAAVTWWLPGATGTVTVALGIAAVAVTAPVVLAGRVAAQAWNGRRVPADRRERARLRAVGQARRLVAELTTLAVAAAALVSVRGRGLVPSGGGDADPLLAAAPVLLAACAALVVVRVAPALVRAAGRLASRSRGLAAPLAVARAHGGATAFVPLLTVTVTVALLVLSGVLVQSVDDGQRTTADVLVGADGRLDGRLDRAEGQAALDALRAAPGVTAVATGSQTTKRAYGEGSRLEATVLLVDAADLAAVRTARGLPVDAGLAGLGDATDARVPALVSPGLLARLDPDGVRLSVLVGSVELDVRGTTALAPDAGVPPVDARDVLRDVSDGDDGLVVVDRSVVAALTDVPAADRAWVSGPGTEAAIAALDLAEPVYSGLTATTAQGWWRTWSGETLTRALTALQLASVGALAVLAVLALVLVVVATSQERGRTLSTLRTLGLDARTARWATLGELAPLVLGGLVGGSVIGLVVPHLVADALGLAWLTGSAAGATVAVVAWPVLVAAAVLTAATLVAVGIEEGLRRRERLGEVLRVGER
ncbi:FtsX-like permease family protein [Cellulomonas sp. HD19AZ1]|uniref:FtsX-like permease family protein n=1 Tax=Cellulomonas TaxID=1707 RepID=UPI001070F63B|nr:FtsX-like permease family protein [Cellulomonas sp. HD19AZ1]TFH70490.1 FtsX-like permease family protein [Cellulomonas sp. HD19AZ1]